MNDATADNRRATAAWIALAASVLPLGFGIAFPGGLTWGIHALGRLGGLAMASGLALVVLAFVAGRTMPSRERSPGRVHPALLAAVTAATFGALAWSLRAATQLLGDGQLIVQDFLLARQGSTDVVVSSLSSILRADHIAPLTSMLHSFAVKSGAPIATALAVESVLLGVGMVCALVFAVARAPWSGILKAWAMVLALGSPAALLYFGYVEQYTAAHLGLGVYVALGARSISQRTRPFAATLALLVATGFHVQALVWWPSAALLWLAASGHARVRRVPILATAATLTMGLALATWLPQDALLDHGTSGTSLWSLRHALDVLQTLWLVFPLLPFAVWLRARAGVSDAGVAFADLLVGPAVVYLFLIDPVLGAARDWDRAAFLSWALAFQTLVCLQSGLRSGRFEPEQLRRWIVPAGAIALVATGSWIALNHSVERTLSRIEAVVLADPHAHEHGFEALTRYHGDRGQWAEAGRWAQAAYESSGNPRLATLASQHLRRAGESDAALALLETAIERRPEDHRVRYELVRLVWDTGDYVRTLEIARAGAHLHPEESIYPFFAGDCLYRLGRREEARGQLARALQLGDLPARSRAHVQRLLTEIGPED